MRKQSIPGRFSPPKRPGYEANHKRYQYQEIDNQAHEDEPNTVNRSDLVDVPSHTTWDPPHSTPSGLMSSNELQ